MMLFVLGPIGLGTRSDIRMFRSYKIVFVTPKSIAKLMFAFGITL